MFRAKCRTAVIEVFSCRRFLCSYPPFAEGSIKYSTSRDVLISFSKEESRSGTHAGGKTNRRNDPAMAACKSRFVAAITERQRVSDECRRRAQTHAPANTQESNLGLGWKFPTSSGSCLHLLVQTDQALLSRARKAPFSCPNNSEAMRSRGLRTVHTNECTRGTIWSPVNSVRLALYLFPFHRDEDRNHSARL
jgi:hypothetical protein